MDNWYIFYVQAGREQTACNFLNKLFNHEESNAFIPQVVRIFRNSSVTRKQLKPMFPGYVFVQTILDEVTFIGLSYDYLKHSKCIFELLGRKNSDYMKLSDDEKNFLLGFCDDEYVTRDSIGFIIGDKVIITSGPLMGLESIIKKINRHKRWAEIELEFFGNMRRTRLALEIVSKVP